MSWRIKSAMTKQTFVTPPPVFFSKRVAGDLIKLWDLYLTEQAVLSIELEITRKEEISFPLYIE